MPASSSRKGASEVLRLDLDIAFAGFSALSARGNRGWRSFFRPDISTFYDIFRFFAPFFNSFNKKRSETTQCRWICPNAHFEYGVHQNQFFGNRDSDPTASHLPAKHRSFQQGLIKL